jgi:catechol 2,3-dioxygenase-like lactoylglutathione lyase family enzyme
MSGMAAALETVILRTTRLQSMADWYAGVLQLGEWEHSPGHLGQRVGPIYFGLDEVAPGAGGGSGCWFHVDDLDRTFERALAAGGEVIEAPAMKPFGYRLATVLDPDGNRVGLAQKRGSNSRGSNAAPEST